MYKNLNDYASTTLDVKFNNSRQLSDIGKQLSAAISFTKNDILLDVITEKKQLIIQNRIIKHCMIKCPDGEVWTSLDYKHHYKQYDQDKDRTIFDFSYIQDDQWLDGQYYIFVGTSDVKNTFSNTPTQHGVELLRSVSQHYYVKKLVAGAGTKLLQNDDFVIIESSQHNYTTQPIQLNSNTIIDLKNGNLQLCYTVEDSVIKDVVNNLYYNIDVQESSDNSNGSSSYSSTDIQHQVLNVSLILYKPLQTTLKYNNLQILQRYDTGWFAFTIRKMFGKLFISQPTRMITDFEV